MANNNIANVNKNDLGFLGEEYQKLFVKCLIEDKQYFGELYSVLDQNKFTNENLRRIVGFMKDRYAEVEIVPSYSDLKVIIRSRVSDEISRNIMISMLKEIYSLKMESIDLIENTCFKFFKQQNLIKALKETEDIIRMGDFNRYNEIVDKIQKAIETNEKKDLGFRLFENLESDLSEDYRITIPTGADKLDDALYGGIGKGQLGIIISPMGTGKAQPLTSKVLTPDGFKTMGDMHIGSEVIGYDGKPHKVIGVFPQGIRPVYKLTFSDGSIVECDEEHLWQVKVNNSVKVITLREILSDVCNDEYYVPKFNLINKTEVKIENIEYDRKDYTQCILIDSDDHLYLTDDFIVTHNTSATTGFAANAAITKCKENNYKGWKVLHIFFEDTEVDIRRKYYGFFTDFDAMYLSDPQIKELALEKMDEDQEKRQLMYENIKAIRMESMTTTASDIETLIKREIAVGFRPDMVIIDYFECLSPERMQYSKSDTWEKEGITIRKLEKMTNKYNIAIWIPVQGNRESIGLDKVGLAQGGGSIKKTQAAHVVITFAQTDEQKTQGRMNIFLAKLRSGKITRNQFYNVAFNNGTCKFDMSNIDADTSAIENANDMERDMEIAAAKARAEAKNMLSK